MYFYSMIRIASPQDSAALLEIYSPFIRNTSITFETEVPSTDDFGNRIQIYLLNYPWLVYESEGKIAGYAYASRHRERTAYQWSVETSVYISDQFTQKGVASALYKKIFAILSLQGFRNAYAVINLPNDRSVAFHEKMGFSYFATYEKVGYKLGRWKNVGWWQLNLNDYTDEPAAPIPFSSLEMDKIRELLNDPKN